MFGSSKVGSYLRGGREFIEWVTYYSQEPAVSVANNLFISLHSAGCESVKPKCTCWKRNTLLSCQFV